MNGDRRTRGRTLREISLAAGVLFAAFAVRVPFLSFESGDYRVLGVWYDLIVANGYAASWRYEFANYNPPYLYLLTAAAYFAPFVPKLLAIKAVSMAGDLLLASYAYRCVRLRYADSRTIPILAGAAVLLAPTVVLNAARWGQTDALYTAFLMVCLHGLLSGRNTRALVAFGVALAVKGQALFLVPLLYWLWARKGIAARRFALVPAVFLLLLVPAALAGRPPFDLLSIYFDYWARYRRLAIEVPNFYHWIPDDYYLFWPLGVALTVALIHGVRRLLDRGRLEMTRETVVFLALLSLVVTPFFLPKMMNRYFFPADVFAIVLAFYRPRLWYLPVGIGLASLSGYGVAVDAAGWLRGAGYAVYRSDLLDWGVVVLALVVADLTRRLLASLGWRFSPGAAAARFSRLVRDRGAALAPLLLLAVAFAALFAAFAGEGRLTRPLDGDGASAKTLARAVSLPPGGGAFISARPDESVPFRAESFDDPPALPGGSAVFDRLLAAFLGRFGDDLSAQLAAARALMLALFCGAALLAYLSLCRVLAFGHPPRRDSNRWVALAATLVAFGSGAAGFADTVAVEGAPAVFGGFLLFHGMAVFLGEGRFRQLLFKTGAALLLGWGAFLLLAPFVALGLSGEWRRRRSGAPGDDASAGWLRPLPAASLPGPIGSPFLALGVFSLGFGLFSPGIPVPRLAPQFPPMYQVAGGAFSPGAAAGPGEGGGFPGSSPASGFPTRLREIGRSVLPYAAFRRDPSAGAAATDAVLPGVGAAAAAASVAGALAARSLPLLTLALSGLGAVFWFGGGFPGAAALSAPGLALTGAALGFSAARRFLRAWAAGSAVGVSAALWLLSFYPPAAAPGGGGGEAEAREAEAREAARALRDDFSRIRQVARPRTERHLFLAPVPVGEAVLGGARAAFFLGGLRWTADPAQRRYAEWLVGASSPGSGGSPAPGELTPDNGTVSLYHRATRDGDLETLLAARPPQARSEFDVHLVSLPSGGDWLVFARDGCRPEDLEGLFVALVFPEEVEDLPRRRRAHGFHDRSFHFADRAFRTGERCVAGILLPHYRRRSIVVGRSLLLRDGSERDLWRVRFTPSEPTRLHPQRGGR